jgi:L-methionine (R)-S-oxide reductase
VTEPSRNADLYQRVRAIAEGETDEIALMATAVCELYHGDDRFDWVGFYRAVGNETLKIGPYQGGHGCLVIPYSRGVCGACARTGEVQLVADVDAFEDHIACSATTKSEIVLPVRDAKGDLIGVLDIDSDQPDAFDEIDVAGLDKLMRDLFARPN